MAFVDENKYNPNFVFRGYDLTEEQVLSALTAATSVKEAARILNISYGTLKSYAKKYVDPMSGKTLFEKFKNPSGKGINRNYDKLTSMYSPEKLFKQGQKTTPERIAKLKEIVISKCIVKLVCNKCGYHERRLTDMKPPLLLNFVNKNKSDWRIENLELLCYNCYFLYIGDPLTKEEIKKIQSYDFDSEAYKEDLQEFHQLDEVYMNHLRDLGLDGEGDIVDSTDFDDNDLVDYTEDEDDLVDHV